MTLREDLARIVKGDVSDDAETLKTYSRDTSIFERTPSVVVFPRNARDVSAAVEYVHEAKTRGENISIAPRSAGTDMTGGPLTNSIALVFSKYMDRMGEIGRDPDTSGETGFAEAEPGVYYRDFEKATLAAQGMIMPSYPASRGICAIGGMVANNSGGELTLHYGKTERYVRELEVVLSDGERVVMHPLFPPELAKKESQKDFEGTIYRSIHALIDAHQEEIEAARPNVTKNSAGYALWNVVDKEHGTFDLTQLVCGSQGTLGIVTKAKLGLVKTKEHRAMLVVFLSDIGILPEIVRRVLAYDPESFESYDDQTFKLAVRFIPQIIGQFGIMQMIKLGVAFIPEMWLVVTGGVPKLVLMAEFAEDTMAEALEKAEDARDALDGLAVRTKIARSEAAPKKYWTIRRR